MPASIPGSGGCHPPRGWKRQRGLAAQADHHRAKAAPPPPDPPPPPASDPVPPPVPSPPSVLTPARNGPCPDIPHLDATNPQPEADARTLYALPVDGPSPNGFPLGAAFWDCEL